MNDPRSLRSAVVMSFVLTLLAAPAPPGVAAPVSAPPGAGPTGVVQGRVLAGGEPGAHADVALVELRRSTQADEEGWFTIAGVPPGPHTLRVRRVDHEPRFQAIVVRPGLNLLGAVQLGGLVVREGPVVIVPGRRPIDPGSTATRHRLDTDKLGHFPAEDVLDLVALVPGVVASHDGLHFRGGRVDEVKQHVDGIEVADPLFGTGLTLPNLAIADATVVVGGFNAETGNALSGVISLTTKEGGRTFAGEAQWHTDRYGEKTKTFHNYDRLTVGMGGPLPLGETTWHATYEGVWSDTDRDLGRTRSTRTWLDFVRLGDRQSNAVSTNAKLAWTPRPGRKLTLENIRNRRRDTPYVHMWSRRGYVQVVAVPDTTAAGDVRLVDRYGRWSFFAEDSTYRETNLADRVPTTDQRFDQWKAVWTQALGRGEVWTARVSRFRFDTRQSVQGKEPWEYEIQSPEYWSGNLEADPFYVTHGDFPLYSKQRTTTWVAKADFTSTRWKGHTVKTGVEGQYNELELLAMQNPNQEANGLPGLNRSDFTNYNPEGSAFLQDRWEYEGLVVNAGLRYDVFTPGPQVPDEDLPRGRYKQQVSPRLGVAYPISDRDVLSFHYGWTYQTPPRNFVFENRGSQSTVAIRGNPDLEPETNISYQATVQHLFSKDVSGQFAVFFKDIFGLISSRQVVDPVTGLRVPVFVNRDYASSRGFEAALAKRFSRRFSAELNYTCSIASGVASDPNTGLQFANGNLLYLPISEQALEWDQRHTLNANLVVRDEGRWGVTFLWTYGSGLPYTPTFRNDRRPDPSYRNTRRLPSHSTLSIVADKELRLWGQDVSFFVDARNVLDARAITDLSPDNAQNPFVNQVGDDYAIYWTETGRAGGAYLRDVDGDRAEDWVAVRDPRVFSEGRNVRVGVGVAF